MADHVAQSFAATTQATLDDVLHAHQARVLALAGATGFVLRANGLVSRLGAVPPDDVVDSIAAAWPVHDEFMHTDRLGEICADAGDHTGIASGVVGFALMNDRSEFVVWFRPELVQAVDWGGDPHNAELAATEGAHVRLSPRRSFDLWRETIRGRSATWDAAAVQAAQRFSRHLNAAVLRDERDSASLAKDLQRVMRPDALPELPGYELSVFAQAAGRGEIGGDWYDAFALGTDLIAIVVGDVAGHGLTAASEMAQLRNILRAYLTDGAQPADALERLDRYMMVHLPGSIATVACATIDSAASTLRISHAGHVPALLVQPHDTSYVALDGDRLLGFRPIERTERVIQLSAGDTIVLYSDGLVETRRLTLDQGLANLARAAADILHGVRIGGRRHRARGAPDHHGSPRRHQPAPGEAQPDRSSGSRSGGGAFL